MMRWVPGVALALIALGSLLLSSAVLMVPSSTFAQEEEVEQPTGGGGQPCTGANICDRAYHPQNAGKPRCCIWAAGPPAGCVNLGHINPNQVHCVVGGNQGADGACTNNQPPPGENCDDCRCKQVGRASECSCQAP